MAVYEEKGKWKVLPDNLLSFVQNRKNPDWVPLERRTDLGRFLGFIRPGTHALAYESNKDLTTLPAMERKKLTKRLYGVQNFDKEGRMSLRLNVAARAPTILIQETGSRGKRTIEDYQTPPRLLRVSARWYSTHLLLEGIHFRMALDGTIDFLPPATARPLPA